MTQPGFTVVIPAYNYAHCLERCITSVVAQNYEHFQVLVINDGSTDNTADVVSAMQGKGTQFDYISQENAGLSAVRNRGVREGKYEWLIFLDADDVMIDGALQEFSNVIEASPDLGLVAAPYENIFSSGKKKITRAPRVSSKRIDNMSRYLNKALSLANGACAMNKKVFANIQYREDLRQTEDLPVFAHVLASYDIGVVPEAPVTQIYKHANSMRNDVEAARKVGMQLEKVIFEESHLPAEAQSLRKQYRARRAISLLKLSFRANDFLAVIEFYHEAFSAAPMLALQPRYLRRYLLSWIKK